MASRNKKGQFVKGQRHSPQTEFKKGQHWRKPQPFREKEWLQKEYVEKQRSTGDIAKDFGVTEAAIVFWLRKHGIPRRSIAQARAVKRWGLEGEKNGMYGKTGKDSSNWRGGLTPLRQQIYSSAAWKKVSKAVRKRDKVCRICGSDKETEIHHIIRFSDAPLLATDEGNLVLLCSECHDKIKNKEKRYEKRFQKILKEVK